MQRIKSLFSCLLSTLYGLLFTVYCLLYSSSAHASTLWYAETKTVKQIDAATNQVTQTIPLAKEAQEPKAIAIDQHDNALWVLSKKQVLKIDSSGSILIRQNLKNIAKDAEPDFLLNKPL